MVMWLMSDRAPPRSYRMMQDFGVRTFLVDPTAVARSQNSTGHRCWAHIFAAVGRAPEDPG
jgi:catalase